MKRLSLLFSISIHLLLVGHLFFYTLDPRKEQTTYSVTLVESAKTSDTKILKEKVQTITQTKKSAKNIKDSNQRLAFKDRFFPSINDSFQKMGTDYFEKYAVNPDAWKLSDSFESDFDLKGSGLNKGQSQFVAALWNKIDRSIVSSPYLSEYGHVGRVFLQFEISRFGELDPSTLRVSAEDSILKVVAIRAVKKALNDENRPQLALDASIKIQTQFAWASQKTCNRIQGVKSNNLSFCRTGENKYKNFSTSEKASTYLSSLAYGFGALEEIEKYKKEESRRKNQFDPFEELRRDPNFNLGS